MEGFKAFMAKVWEVMKRIGAVLLDICKRAWELICKYAPIVWDAIKRFCVSVWRAAKSGTAKLLGVDEQLNKRAVYIAMASFATIIVLFILVLTT